MLSSAVESGDQERLDSVRIKLGYLVPTAPEHIKVITVDDKVAMMRKMQEELLKQQNAKEGQS